MLDGRTLWNPAHQIAKLYVEITGGISEVVKTPVGFTYNLRDEYVIDATSFAIFVDTVLVWVSRTSHPVFRSFTDGIMATSLVMADRGGITIPSLRAAADGDTTSRVDVKRWAFLCGEFASSMPGDDL
jgi:hypothetical protein